MKSGLTCPQCGSQIPLDDVNVTTNVALCRRCGQNWNYSELIADNAAERFDPQISENPPAGAWYRELPPRGFEVGVSTRSSQFIFLVPFICIWSGISIGGIYGGQIAKRHFNPGQSLFGIPFVIGTVYLCGTAVMAAAGKVVVTVDGDEGVVFTGVGPIGRRRRFNWYNVKSVRQTETKRSARRITLFAGEKQIHFGGFGLKEERFNFLLGMLRKKWRETGHASRPLVS
jgi:hypothetical protein